MKAKDRHQFILDLLKEKTVVDINALKSALNVSEMTVRRDLAKLESEGYLLRTHGGAREYPTNLFELPLDRRMVSMDSEKKAIGAYAATFVENGDVVMMDASTTVYYMVKHLMDKKITVITDNLSVAIGFAESKTVEVLVLGGTLRKTSLYLYGYDTLDMIKRYNADKLFMSSSFIEVENGITDVNRDAGVSKQALMACAGAKYLLMDTSKFGGKGYYNVCLLDKFDHLITYRDKYSGSQGKVAEVIEACQKRGVRVSYSNIALENKKKR